jgi:serine/threonine-protein kinase
MIGRTLDAQYRVDGILGEGAMGVVFRGVNLAMDKAVAIKMMRKDTFDTPDAVERFKREARVWSQLNHPVITQVFDFGIQDGMPFLVMELVEGADLSEVLKKETALRPMRALALMRQLAAALEEAHRLGVVHRDIKPQNMKLLRYQPGGRIVLKVLDFGMAKQVGNKAQSLTAPGILVGTPKYIAPEQVTENPKIDGRTDLYAAGVLFYELLTGQAPFLGTPHEVLFAHLGSEPKPLPDTVPQVVQDVVMRLLRKKPEERYPDAAALDQALEAAEESLRAGASGMHSGMSFPPVTANSAISGMLTPVAGIPAARVNALAGGGLGDISGGVRVPSQSSSHTPAPRSAASTPPPALTPPAVAVAAQPRGGHAGRFVWPLLFVLVMCGSAGLFYGLRHSLTMQRTLAGWLSFYKVPQDEEVQRALAALQTAAQNKNWAAVLVGIEDLQRRYGNTLLPAQQSELAALRQKVLSEQPMQELYQRIEAAAQKRDHEEVVRLYGQITADSVYRSLAQPAYETASEAFVSNHLVQAATLREQHRCAEFTAEVQKLLDTVPGHPLVRAEQRKPCTSNGDATPVTPTASGDEPALLSEAELAEAPPLAEAARLYGDKQYTAALAAAQPLTNDRNPRVAALALRVAAASACQLGDAATVNRLYKRLGAGDQATIAGLCQGHGIQLGSAGHHDKHGTETTPARPGEPQHPLPPPPPIPGEP